MLRQLLRQAQRCGAVLQSANCYGMVCQATRFMTFATPAASSSGCNNWASRLASNVLALGAGSIVLTGTVFAASAGERTYIMVKPDGVHRGLVADIIKRLEQKGYKLVGIKIVVPSKDLAARHYAEHDGKPFFPKLVDFLSAGPVVAMVWEGKEVIKYGRTMIGATNPLASSPGTIRGDYGIDVGRNIIHGSDSVESAQKEIALWFKPEELADYQLVTRTWIYE